MIIRVDVHPKCVHFGLGLGLVSYGLGLGLGLATAGLDYIPGQNTIRYYTLHQLSLIHI